MPPVEHFTVAEPDFDAPELCLMVVVNGTDYFARLLVERRGSFVDFRVVAAAGGVAGEVLCSGRIDPESIRDLVALLAIPTTETP